MKKWGKDELITVLNIIYMIIRYRQMLDIPLRHQCKFKFTSKKMNDWRNITVESLLKAAY